MCLAVDKDATNRMEAEGRPSLQLTRHHTQHIFFPKPHLPVSQFHKKYIRFVALTDLPVYNKCFNKTHPTAS